MVDNNTMDNEWESIVTEEGLPIIQAVAKDGAIQSSIRSLLLWGVINICVWFIFGRTNYSIFKEMSNPTITIYILFLGSLILGLLMILIATFGSILRTLLVMLLDSIFLFLIGGWNILHDFIAVDALRPFGYTIKQSSINTFFILLGIAQIVWAFKRFFYFQRVMNWSPANISESEMLGIKEQLQNFISSKELPEQGIFKVTSVSFALGGIPLTQSIQYTVKLLDNYILLVSSKMDNCLTINRKLITSESFIPGPIGDLTPTVDLNGWKVMTVLSAFYLKKWSGVSVTADDIYKLKMAKGSSLSIIKPFLESDNIKLRIAAISALGAIVKPDAKIIVISFLDETNPSVKAMAIDTCREMKINSLHDKIIPLIDATDPIVRIASIKYLAAFPNDRGNFAIEKASKQESVGEVKKEFMKALKILKLNT